MVVVSFIIHALQPDAIPVAIVIAAVRLVKIILRDGPAFVATVVAVVVGGNKKRAKRALAVLQILRGKE